MNKLTFGLSAALIIAVTSGSALAQSDATMRNWVVAMKEAPRGPFKQLRWFCEDGTIHPLQPPDPCDTRGGGVEHGEWTDRTKDLRANGFYIGNVLASADLKSIVRAPGVSDLLNQILIEQFLSNIDDGWIYRKARFYRGGFQDEDEQKYASGLITGMSRKPAWTEKGYGTLRTAASLLAHGADVNSATNIRNDSMALGELDPKFLDIRYKIHSKPDADDAVAVRNYAQGVSDPDLKQRYLKLADDIKQLYSAGSISDQLNSMAAVTSSKGRLGKLLKHGAKALSRTSDPARRFEVSGKLMALLRDDLKTLMVGGQRLKALDTSLALEAVNYASATALRAKMLRATRRERLNWLEASVSAIYGAGLISDRERGELRTVFEQLRADRIPLSDYKRDLDYLGRVPGWGTQNMRFHYFKSMQKLAKIEPLAERFIQDQLRGSPLFFYSNLLDSLIKSANQTAGVGSQLFGRDVGSGFRSLNPGLARGTLYMKAPSHIGDFDSKGIYLLPETVAELPPVAGIMTAGEGNPLSHVQLLARNLGIPNVGINESLIPQLKPYDGKSVILAVSPAGSVQLSADDGSLDSVLNQASAGATAMIRPDLNKLDLNQRSFIPLSRLRASDSGRTVGPKAAKLGELRHSYPEAVAEGLAIPFGAFRALMEQPYDNSGLTVYDWMVGEYGKLAKMTPDSSARKNATESFRAKLQDWILHADPGEAFRSELRAAMEKTFGPDGSYGVFVRSDTNVEDLPGFTGAGLNLTVGNVVGFDNVIAAISKVWASPFSERAFSWRQAHMDQPEHVYPAILLLLSVPSEKSGVLVTQDIDNGNRDWISVAINEGIGGAVDGQASESLRINKKTGKVRVLAQATAPTRRVLGRSGGLQEVPVSGSDRVLKPAEAKLLIAFVNELPKRFPPIVNDKGQPAPADVEFGFLKGKLRLFQLRPFLESAKVQDSGYLKSLDKNMKGKMGQTIDMNAIPKGN